MTSAADRTRRLAGIREGGQFATEARAEPDVTLAGGTPVEVEQAQEALREARAAAYDEAAAELARLEAEAAGMEDSAHWSAEGGWDDARQWQDAADAMAPRIDAQRALVDALGDTSRRDGIFDSPVDLMRACEDDDSEFGRRRARAAERAALASAYGPRNLSEQVLPENLTQARKALNATHAPGRAVVLHRIDTIGREPLEVRGNVDSPLHVVVNSGFAHLRITSGDVIVYANSPLGHPIDVEGDATVTVVSAPRRKVGVHVKDAGVAVLLCDEGVHGYQHREAGDGSLDVVRADDASDRVTVRTPSRPDAVRPDSNDLSATL